MSDTYNDDKANLTQALKDSSARAVIWNILNICGVGSPCFTGNSRTFYNEGRRDVGLEIIDLLDDVDPAAYPRLMLENIERLGDENAE